MSKNALVILLLAVLCVSITSCSSDNEDEDEGVVVLPEDSWTSDGYFDGMIYYQIMSNLSSSVEVTKAVSSIRDAVIPKYVKLNDKKYIVASIGEKAFYGCKWMSTVSIPSGVAEIGDDAFYGCEELNAVYITDISTWCSLTFNMEHSSSANPLYYAKRLFLNGKEVSELSIPDGVVAIGAGSFYNCSSINSVHFPNSLKEIGEYAFYRNSNISTLSIPQEVAEVGNRAFESCKNLTSVSIGTGIKRIGNYAFYECPILREIRISAETPPQGYPYLPWIANPYESNPYIYVPRSSLDLYKAYWSDYADWILGIKD